MRGAAPAAIVAAVFLCLVVVNLSSVKLLPLHLSAAPILLQALSKAQQIGLDREIRTADQELGNAQRQLAQAQGLTSGLQPRAFADGMNQALMQRGARGQAGLATSLGFGLTAKRKAPETMLAGGIGGWGSGEEWDNAEDWQVSMGLDKGCEDILEERKNGNPGWKRIDGERRVKCIPNKKVNPMMWPFDAPGKVWAHDSTDSTKEDGQWPYEETDLKDYVERANEEDPTVAWSDGVWHETQPEDAGEEGDDAETE